MSSANSNSNEQQPLLLVDAYLQKTLLLKTQKGASGLHVDIADRKRVSDYQNSNTRTTTKSTTAKKRSKIMNNRQKVFKEILSLLYWTMLAACTVGPGTVVTCARAGAEFQLNLIWALIFASVMAYTLQEGTARLTINSGKSLGQCLQVKYKHGRLVWRVGVVCWVVAISVFLGELYIISSRII